MNQDARSNYMSTFSDAAVQDAPWKKFAPSGLTESERETFADENRRNIAYCVGRYVFSNPDVVGAEEKLYENIIQSTQLEDPRSFVVEHVQEKIRRYSTAFNLNKSSQEA